MKYNLNTLILDSATYLTYLYENSRLNHCNYDKFMSIYEKDLMDEYTNLISMCNKHNIDIFPYFYTLKIVPPNDRHAFEKFFITCLKKNDMLVNDDIQLSTDIASSSPEHLATFIATMQYFFL